MSILRIVCANPQCQTVLRIHARQAGRRIRCPACRIALIAPRISGSAATAHGEGDTEDLDPPPPLWMTLLFVAGLLIGFVLVVLAAVGFEIYLYVNSQPVNKGQVADLLVAGPWKVRPRDKSLPPLPDETDPWATAETVWTFLENGKAQTGRVLAETNRYDRKVANGFRTWTWRTDDNVLTLELDNAPTSTTLKYTAKQENDKLVLVPQRDEDPLLTLQRTEPVKTFPDLRVVFYGGVLAPMLVSFLLAWLISREVFYAGYLRFALGWPLTVLLGVALGAGAGYLLDVLNDHSHGAAPYWMVLAFVQGVVGLITGLGLAVLSCLRPT
jgi:hypothetical protein